jgi:hypothetical protein
VHIRMSTRHRTASSQTGAQVSIAWLTAIAIVLCLYGATAWPETVDAMSAGPPAADRMELTQAQPQLPPSRITPAAPKL